MSEQSFGGDWTEIKLGQLKKYLERYQDVMKNQHFTSWYVDAFAGTGSRSIPERDSSPDQNLSLIEDESCAEGDAQRYREGSAKIALSLRRPFHRYLFIEKAKWKCEALRARISEEFGNLEERCTVLQEDSNSALCSWCKERNWSKERAVVFLDPFGLQVNWDTVRVLGTTNGVDLWYLFPLNVLRLLKRTGGIDPSWRERLNSVFGTSKWEERFYPRSQSSLFADVEIIERTATAENVKSFVEERLKQCFADVAKGRVLKNSRNSPIFLLCFAVANQRGAPIAKRIAQSILKG